MRPCPTNPTTATTTPLLLRFLLRFGSTMSSILSSNSLVLATAMVVSSTMIFLALSKQKNPEIDKNEDSAQYPDQNLRSCLCSEEKKRREGKKKKRVHFAEDVKDKEEESVEYRKERVLNSASNSRIDGGCRNQIPGIQRMPANRIALYSGILRDRVHRLECSH